MKPRILLFLLLFSFFSALSVSAVPILVTASAGKKNFCLAAPGCAASLCIDTLDAEVVTIAAQALRGDIKLITGVESTIVNQLNKNQPVIIGTLGKSRLIDQLVASGKISAEKVSGKWETFCISVVKNPYEGVENALVIYGSDPRGTAFGVFELSKLIGVSPWVWWADVLPQNRSSIYITAGESIYGPPSVQYRGIFLNDEDWGLQPWAAKNIDTDIKDIGPKTYAKIFELMLRVKANYIWPAMHPCTKAFWYYPGNPEMARKYNIVLGASHCEPLLRNNVDEWTNNFKTEYGKVPGAWSWATNKPDIQRYWIDRVKSSRNNDAIYTIGMRGIHDSSMPGYKTDSAKQTALIDVIANQRSILSTNLGKEASQIPQIFCPYKEALTLYRLGLNLPDDVTLVWADDNFGYIRQLSNPKEQLRSGGSGVYYHFSYWGYPDDFLWLSTNSPMLASFELTKAYEMNAKKLWIVNVGDIKPNEMELQFAMDLGWDVNAWTPEKAHLYAKHWAAETFGDEFGESIGRIKDEFYRLAASGKPEHLVSVNYTDAEIAQRLVDYDHLVEASKKVEKRIPSRLQDAYFQLIAYPIEAAASMNVKILCARQSLTDAAKGKVTALDLSAKALFAYQRIIDLTKKYNTEIADGKWNGMMDYAPRGLARFQAPKVATKDSVKNVEFASVATNNIKVIPAAHFSDKGESGHTIVEIPGLGIEKSAMTVRPMNMTSYTAANVSSAPYLEYNVPVYKGNNSITVRCLPTFPLYTSMELRYAISVNGKTPEFFNIATSAETRPWAKNLLRGYVLGESNYQSDTDKTIKVRVYFADPGLVICDVTVSGLK